MLTTLSRISSGTFRSWSYTPLAEECENITGALVTSNVSDIVLLETCARSTNIPIRFISITISLPNSDNPLFLTGRVVSACAASALEYGYRKYKIPLKIPETKKIKRYLDLSTLWHQ